MKKIILILLITLDVFGLAVIPMHWQTIKGAPYVVGEHNCVVSVQTLAPKGQQWIYASNADTLLVGQVIAYTKIVYPRSTYYTNVIDTIIGDTLFLRERLQDTVGTGSNIFSFYDNQSHPTNQGMYAIIDNAASVIDNNNMMCDSVRVFNAVGSDLTGFKAVGTPVVSLDSVNSILNPGSRQYPSLVVIADNNEGVSYPIRTLSGTYTYDIMLNPGDSGIVKIEILSNTTVVKTVYDTGYTSKISWIKGSVDISGSFLTVRVTSTLNGSVFKIGCIRLTYNTDDSVNLNSGTHVIIGDSWSAYSAFSGALETHYPLATVRNKGIGGSTAYSTYLKFDSLLNGITPTFIWLMVGTNDYWGGNPIGLDSFNVNLRKLINKCDSTGAKTIVFDPSVGPKTYGTYDDWELTERSSEYALVGDYIPDVKLVLDSTIGTLPVDSLYYILSPAMLGVGNMADTQTSGIYPIWSADNIVATVQNTSAGYGHVYDTAQSKWVMRNDATDDRVSLGQKGYNDWNQFTLFYWLKFNNISSVGYNLLIRQYDASYTVNIGNSLNVFSAQVTRGATGSGSFTTSSYISNNTPTCIAVRYDRYGLSNSDRLKIYVDGVRVPLTFTGTISDAGTPQVFSTQTCFIMRYTGTNVTTTMVYKNVAKTDSEILSISQSGPTFNCYMLADNNDSIAKLTDVEPICKTNAIGISQFALYKNIAVDSLKINGTLATLASASTDSVLVTPASTMYPGRYTLSIYSGGSVYYFPYIVAKSDLVGNNLLNVGTGL